MRVLLISHTCQSRREGQSKAECLGRMRDVELRVLSPQRWRHYGRWREAEAPASASFDFVAGRVRWPWLMGAQNYLHWYPDLRRMLLDFRPHVIDLWEEPWGLVSAHACWLLGRILPSARLISETEQNIAQVLPPPFEQLRSYTLRRADHVIGRSAEAVAVVRGKGYCGPATVVPNAFDDQLFRPLDRGECRRALGLTGFVVGYVGRLVEEKGLTDLLEAVAKCPGDVNLILVGGGPLRKELRRRAEALGIAGRVRLEPPRGLEELPAYMNAMDVLVLPSRTTARWKEQFGRVVIEAHGCGTPVIGTRSGAIPEVVGAGGMIVPERDWGALAEAITTLCEDRALAARLGQAGYDTAVSQYTWEQVARRMHEIYLRVLDQPVRTAARPSLVAQPS